METEVKEAVSAAGLPVGVHGDEGFFAKVGVRFGGSNGPEVTRITVTNDLPGLHCSMERVRVFAGDELLWEGPLHSLEGVSYWPGYRTLRVTIE